jgi:SAM-dependent methyltransferase
MAADPLFGGIKQPYLLDNAWQDARQRLTLLETRLDPGTIYHLQALGVGPGWHCLTVGSGGGSITAWLCRQVGPSGHVVATDIDTRFLEALDYPNLEVRRHDIVADQLEEGAFDLIQVRGVLLHLAERQRALRRMVAALKAGGWLLAEETDGTSMAPLTDARTQDGRLFLQFRDAFVATLAAAGGDYYYGRRLHGDVCDQGLVEVAVEGRVHLARGGGALARFWRLALEQVHERLVRSGGFSEQQAEDTYRLLDNPDFAFTTSTIWAVRGKRP